MQLEKITAGTMADALREVKRLLGNDAIILSTRTVSQRHWLFRRREVVEVTAGKGMNVMPRRASPPVRAQPPAAAVEPIMRSIPAARAYAANSKLAPAATALAEPPGKSLLATPAAQSVAMMSFAGEISTLKTMVSDLVQEVRHCRTPSGRPTMIRGRQRTAVLRIGRHAAAARKYGGQAQWHNDRHGGQLPECR